MARREVGREAGKEKNDPQSKPVLARQRSGHIDIEISQVRNSRK